MSEQLLRERLGGAAILALRPQVGHRLGTELLDQLAGALDDLARDRTVRALVLTGAGESHFSAGIDLAVLASCDPATIERWRLAQCRVVDALMHWPGATVAAINGVCDGAGTELALACDFRVAEQGAVIAMRDAGMGLVPLAGGTLLLERRVGPAWARRLLMAGETLDAAAACRIGLVEEVVAVGLSKIVALGLADKVARQGADAVRTLRRLLTPQPDEALLRQRDAARDAVASLLGGEEWVAGVTAAQAGTDPPWVEDD